MIIKRILSSEEVKSRLANFEIDKIKDLYILDYSPGMSTNYANFANLSIYKINTILQALNNERYTFLELYYVKDAKEENSDEL